MSLTTCFHGYIKRGYPSEFLALLQATIGGIIVVRDDKDYGGKFYPALSKEYKLPKEGESLVLRATTPIPCICGNLMFADVKSFTLRIKQHQFTAEEPNDGYATGYDMELIDFIDLPYTEKTKHYFTPFIDALTMYGYSSYDISDEYSDKTTHIDCENDQHPCVSTILDNMTQFQVYWKTIIDLFGEDTTFDEMAKINEEAEKYAQPIVKAWIDHYEEMSKLYKAETKRNQKMIEMIQYDYSVLKAKALAKMKLSKKNLSNEKICRAIAKNNVFYKKSGYESEDLVMLEKMFA